MRFSDSVVTTVLAVLVLCLLDFQRVGAMNEVKNTFTPGDIGNLTLPYVCERIQQLSACISQVTFVIDKRDGQKNVFGTVYFGNRSHRSHRSSFGTKKLNDTEMACAEEVIKQRSVPMSHFNLEECTSPDDTECMHFSKKVLTELKQPAYRVIPDAAVNPIGLVPRNGVFVASGADYVRELTAVMNGDDHPFVERLITELSRGNIFVGASAVVCPRINELSGQKDFSKVVFVIPNSGDDRKIFGILYCSNGSGRQQRRHVRRQNIILSAEERFVITLTAAEASDPVGLIKQRIGGEQRIAGARGGLNSNRGFTFTEYETKNVHLLTYSR